MSPRTGRPPSDDPRRRLISIRLTDSEYELVTRAASYKDVPLAVWVRERVLAAAKRALQG